MTTAAAQSFEWLHELTRQQHRGRGDTWAAARDRAARLAGVERTYAKRIWDRWQHMKDVSGEAALKLKAAYEAQCLYHETRAGELRQEREARREAFAAGHGPSSGRSGHEPS